MNKIGTSFKVYILLVLVLAVSNAVQVFLPSYQSFLPTAPLPAPLLVIALVNAGIASLLYGGLGFIGIVLSKKLGFVDIWDSGVSNRQRFLVPGLVGAALGVGLIVADIVFSRFNGIGRLIHPPFPASIFASLSAGIGEEMLFRLFFIPFWVWLISVVILRKRWQGQVFWAVSAVSALVFALGHLPALMLLFNFTSLNEISPVLYIEIILLNGVISMVAAYYLRKYGFLAAAGVHFWTDIFWHVVWGLF